MSSKYANLPDIDTTNPDVYETPDVPESVSLGHDSDDSDGDYEGLHASGSSSNLLALATAGRYSSSKGPATTNGKDEAIDGSRLNTSKAREKFRQLKGAGHRLKPDAPRSSRPSTSRLPEATTYTLRHARLNPRDLSSTAQRQLRRDAALTGEDESSLLYEPETPTERLRRLRFEMEELESELERKAEAQKEAGMPDDEEEAAYETEDSLPAKDDADKTRPTRRRRKKAKVDENGEVSPAILIAQLRRLRGNLSRMSVGTENEDSAEGTEGTSAADAGSMARTHALLAKLGEMKDVASIPELSANFDGNSLERSPGETVTPNSTSRIDARLQVLEKYVGANEADIDETRPLPPPLLSTLARLERQLQLFTQPRHLDTIARRVKVLVTDLERVHEARRKIGDTRPLNVALSSGITITTGPPTTSSSAAAATGGGTGGYDPPLPPDALQKIDGIFTLLPRIDALIPLTPHLLTRLRSLSTLHSSSLTFQQDVESAQQDVENLKRSNASLHTLLEGLEENMSANQGVVKANLESLQDRIASVMERMDALAR